MLTCPNCGKVLTRCIDLQVLLARGTHKIFCLCCCHPLVIQTKSIGKITSVEMGTHQSDDFIVAMKGELK